MDKIKLLRILAEEDTIGHELRVLEDEVSLNETEEGVTDSWDSLATIKEIVEGELNGR